MTNTFFSIFYTIKNIAYRYFLWSKDDNLKHNHFKNLVPNIIGKDSSDREEVIIPLFDDESMIKMVFSFIKNHQIDVKYKLRFLYVLTGIDHHHKIWKVILDKYFFRYHILKVSKLYHIPIGAIVYSNFLQRYHKAQQNIPTKEDLLAYSYNDIVLGDLVYDTYLRYRSRPAADLQDPELYRIIGYAEALADYWTMALRDKRPAFFLFPYCAYIHWGIPTRVAMKSGINVLVYGSPNYYLAKPTQEFPYHTKNFNLYPVIWQRLSDKEGKLAVAQKRIEERLHGKKAADLAYMRQSAYEGASVTYQPDSGRPFAIVFLHCFFDSPHVYGDLIFPDFVDWIQHILNFAKRNPQFDFLVKPHPNGIPGNDPIVASFREEYAAYPNIIFLDKNISNQSLAGLRPNGIFTVYGTIAHEFAYLRLPVICAGENPHKMYHFVHQPTTVNAFNYFLENLDTLGLPENYDKEKILEFYYMHYLYFAPGIDAITHPIQNDFHKGTWSMYSQIEIEKLIYS
ncbi:MAG: hypothetical protein NWS63_14635 [Saprospiraceae bacterium]|nr:hypothetical protein [Saprospiraceae bacterium]